MNSELLNPNYRLLPETYLFSQIARRIAEFQERHPEREVIRLVAMGLSNKEIAERMFIAVNTVMTHRRNISRKLDIHATAGLTIYAIVNGIINVEDVKL